jgi:hypothetical protein
MSFITHKITVAHKDDLLIGKPIFDFLPQVNINKEKEIQILESWMNDFSQRGIPFIVTERITYKRQNKIKINTLWKEEKRFTIKQSTIIYRGGKT